MKTNYKYMVWKGKAEKRICKEHKFSWSGKIPCTGVYRCVFCGRTKEEA